MSFEQFTNVFGGGCPGHVLSEQPGARKFSLGGLLLGGGAECESEVRGVFGCENGYRLRMKRR